MDYQALLVTACKVVLPNYSEQFQFQGQFQEHHGWTTLPGWVRSSKKEFK